MSVPFQGLQLELNFPQSLGVYEKYEDAQKVVDHLSDQRFPVENLAIVGTDLKLVERVTGRKDWKSVLVSSALNGVSMGLLVGILWLLFAPAQAVWAMMLVAIGIAVVLSMIFGAIGYAATGGKRDFNSIRTTIPRRFELLCEHKHALAAREIIDGMPGARAAAFE